ncbi:MAG TPA: hypothetical protein P5084_04090 [Paludibacter sp.]|nr:hypothetical protein [Paludibacter sp.]
MKKVFLKFAIVLLSVFTVFTSCDEEVIDPDAAEKDAPNEVIVKADITGTRQWVKDSVYIIKGQINVSGTLNIAAGTVIKGDKITKGTLVVLPEGKINAIGTATSPIVFTSRLAPGLRSAGDWGGLIIVGKAPVNQSNPSIEGLSREVTYGGGTDAAHSSGKLQYVRIEFSGIALQPDKETNGLTLCAVGSGTTIDHIQVSFCGDDSFEWFGGKVNAKYLIAYLGLDDEFDADYGFQGKVQFALGVRNPRIADVSTSNGFESDNDGSGTTASPQTAPVFSNVTLIGPWRTSTDGNVNSMYGAGMHLRRNTSLSVFNSVFAGWNTGLLLDATTTYGNATAGNLAIQNCALVASKVKAINGAGGVTETQAAEFYNTAAFKNLIIADNATAKISNSFYDAKKTGTAAIPTSFLPETGSALLGAGEFSHTKLADSFFDKTATYVGAFGATDWTKESWVNFDPQNTVY